MSTLRTRRHLEMYLGAPLSTLEAIAADLSTGTGVELVTLRSKGKARVITIPTDETVRNVQRRILSLLTPVQMDLPNMVTGYVRGRSSMTNAHSHTGSAFLQKFDLRDFFSHIDVDAVEGGLREAGFHDEVAQLIALLTTCDGRLPTGFSTSPAIANLACHTLDTELASLAAAEGLRLTRYADDITFSGPELFDVSDQVRSIAESSGHAINDQKTRTLKRGQPMYVTGLSISEPDRPRLPRPFKRRLRQELYFISVRGLAEHASWRGGKPEGVRFRMGGQLAYAGAVEPDWVARLKTEFPSAYGEVARMRSQLSDAKRRERLVHLAARVVAREDPAPELYVPSATIA